MAYNFREIEEKWQKRWLRDKTFRADDKSKKPKYYQLETFPYPSAAGLHVGHPKGYIAEDIHARYKRMRGFEILYSMGWDAFGLPTENYAIKVGRSPKEVALENIENFRRQINMFGLSYDWDREVNTSDPHYYKWTQWIFLQLFKRGLAYRKKALVNWCPNCKTVLANEQVIQESGGNVCERCKAEIGQKEKEQWFLKITDYADRLVDDLEGLDWPEATIRRQKNWIGRSEGAIISFTIADKISVDVFTTRPDTLFGATYLVLAPDHPFIKTAQDRISNWGEVEKYVDKSRKKTELERISVGKEKTGVELKGIKAINPATKEEIPIWVADYVLASYGTGSIMAVPAHDERDFEFAKKFNLPIKKVIRSNKDKADEVYDGEGEMINSGKFNGLNSKEAEGKITRFVGGQSKVQYKLRDWSVSRQRYWGVPIPIIYCDKCGVIPVSESDLPVLLPELDDYRPKGVPPLANSPDFIETSCPKCSRKARRDPETLDTFVDSSWYYLRYADPQNARAIFDKSKVNHWLPVDLYVIGAEHTVLHLLYSRFIVKFLFDEGYLSFNEPFLKIRHVGLILGEDSQKMSKSRGNVINPDELAGKYGADSLRIYEMFMGPFEDGQPWDPQGIVGAYRFLGRVWEYVTQIIKSPSYGKDSSDEKTSILHKTIKKVGEDIEGLKFNTAISSLMILLNDLSSGGSNKYIILSPENLASFIKLLYPFAPHISQELWGVIGRDGFIDFESWPEYDIDVVADDTFSLVIQVNGKVRDNVDIKIGVHKEEAEKIARGRDKIKPFLANKEVKRVVFVPNRLINFVL